MNGSQLGTDGKLSKSYCSFGKIKNPGTNVDFAFFFIKSYGKSILKISEPGFPHNFAKNDHQDLKVGCTDASRRQLQSVLKIGV